MTTPAPSERHDPPSASRFLPMALVTWAVIGLVLVLVVALVVVQLTEGPRAPATPPVVAAAPPSVLSAISALPPASFDAAAGDAGSGPQTLTGQPLLQLDGRAEVVFVGAESSPFSAAQSWALVVALSRFGTFSHLAVAPSPSSEIFGRTPGFSFEGTVYRSSDVILEATESDANTLSSVAPAGYPALESPSSAIDGLMRRYGEQGSAAGLPFLDVANRLTSVGSGIGFSPGLLAGDSMSQVAAELSNPSSLAGQAVLGVADDLVAAVCSADGGRPATVCTSVAVETAAERLGLS